MIKGTHMDYELMQKILANDKILCEMLELNWLDQFTLNVEGPSSKERKMENYMRLIKLSPKKLPEEKKCVVDVMNAATP